MAVYTRRLSAGEDSSGGPTVVYTAPSDGSVVVVRDISIQSISGSDHGLVILNLPDTTQTVLLSAVPMEGLHSYHWSGRQVIEAGETISVYTGGGDIRWLITGYVLAGS